MSDLRTAAQQALEALELGDEWHPSTLAAITALRAALAQQAEPVEPVAWVASKDGRVIYDDASTDDGLLRVSGDFENDEQRSRYAQRIVDKLNAALAQQAEPVQEPVAWSGYDLDGMVEAFSRVIEAHYQRANPFQHPIDMDAQMALRILRGFIPAMKAYAVPPQRKPLPLKTVEKLIYENTKISPNVADDRELLGYIVNAVRAVERAHGIKE